MKPEIVMLVAITSVVLTVMLMQIRTIRLQKSRIDGMEKQQEQLTSTINAICSGAVGVDRRVANLERSGREIKQRQEDMEMYQTDERPYGEAIQMVQKGAEAERLMDEMGMSKSEADLIVMLHGMKKAG